MTDIEIRYPRFFSFLLGDKCIRERFPSEWNELSSKQLRGISKLFFTKEKEVYRFRILVIKLLLNLNWAQVMYMGKDIVFLYPYIKFLEEDNRLTDNKILSFKAKGVKLYGPIGGFETLKADEWTEADQAFMDYNESGDMKDLDRMIAILYREQNKAMHPGHPQWKKDMRMEFNEHQVEMRARCLENVDPGVKFGILIWYMGCRQEWENLFDRVFKGEKQSIESFGWQETIQKLSGKAFGDLAATEHTYMYKLMLNMEITLKDDEFMKEKERHRKLAKR